MDSIEIIDSCRILTYGKSTKCLKSGSGIHISDDTFLTKVIKLKSTQLNSTDMALIRENNLEKIVLKFNEKEFIIFYVKLVFGLYICLILAHM